MAHSSLAMSDIGQVVGKLYELRDQLDPGERAVLEDLLRLGGVAETTPPQYNPFLPGVHANPYPHYHLIQAENPVHWSDAMQAWVISRRADVVAALRDPRLSFRTGSKTIMASVPAEEHDDIKAVSRFQGSLLNEVDPPVHTRLRSIMIRAMAATIEPQRRPHIEAIANQLLDAVEPAGEMDIIADFAYPLPAIVGEDLLGIPAPDRERFGQLIRDVVCTFSEGFTRTAAMRRGEAAVLELTAYLEALLAERRERPREDVLSALVRDARATEDERVLIAANIILGMHENLTHAIGLAMNLILRDPALQQWLLLHPERLPAAVEEMLRYEGTSPILSRVTLEEIEIGATRIPRGQRVILLLAAANRDADHFEDPDRYVPNRCPNSHIAFGTGKRVCPGSALARLILHVAVATLLTRFPSLELTEWESSWREEINIHGLSVLKVSFARDPAHRAQSGHAMAHPAGNHGIPAGI
jgi:cytochrome P450